MTVEDIFTKLVNHMVEGVVFHDQMAEAYDFLGLYGFAKCHLYHCMEEMKGQKELLHYYATHHHKLLNLSRNYNPEIIPDNWYKYDTMAVDINTKRTSVKNLMEKWVEWERNTKKLYSEMYRELFSIGEIAAAKEILCYVYDVSEELKHAEKKLIKLDTLGYDIGTIIKWQDPMYKKYKNRFRHLF